MFSNSWYRVAMLKPRMRNHAQIHRHIYRGDVWFVLQNHSTGKFHRFTPIANLVIGLMDGKRTVQEIWDLACNRLGDDAPSQDEVIKLMSDLYQADVLQSNAPPDVSELHKRRRKHERTRWKQYLGNPLSLRFPLVDPDTLLQRLLPYYKPLFGWFGALVWAGAFGWAIILGAMHWEDLTTDVMDRVFNIENLLVMWFVFPALKLLHELGHAMAIKVDGGEVHEMGIMLLVFMPIPYVDASAATAFRDKRGRMVVGAAGMLVDLFIASLALFAWVHLEPGIERAIAYNIVLVAGVTTLLFNANPLLRYDGYYILADYLEIPNLAQRANEYLGYLTNRYLFGVEGGRTPVSADGERGWFFFYAIASFFYRMFIMVSIAILVASQFFILGIILAFWAFATMLILPAFKKIQYLIVSPTLINHRQRAVLTSVAIFGIVLALIFFYPVPSATQAEGVIWAPEDTQVRTTVDGFIAKILPKPDQKVVQGEVLIQCEDPELDAKVSVLRAQIAELDARYGATIWSNKVQADMYREQRGHLSATLEHAIQRQSALLVRSPADGVFVMQDAQNALGRFVKRGQVLAYVSHDTASLVRVVVVQAEGDLVATRTQRVEIRSADRISHPMQARIRREIPAATDELPSMTLSLQGGGKIGLDPTKSDGKSLEKLFVLDLELPPGEQPNYLGGRIYVRFEHDPEPLAEQWYRGVRRIFLKKFNV